MVTRSDLRDYLKTLLVVDQIPDYCPNGLQVQGRSDIRKIITGVSACRALIEAAVDEEADALLVHHGYFWKKENPRITGIKHKRIQLLIENDLNLFAYHLPLDVHHEFGNNKQLANLLHLTITENFTIEGLDLGWKGELADPLTPADFSKKIEKQLSRKPLHIPAEKELIRTVAWCTGGAQGFIDQAIAQDIDAYISGEISESAVHTARESNVHYFAAGHHATERYGVIALGKHLADKFGITHQFIDIDNPV